MRRLFAVVVLLAATAKGEVRTWTSAGGDESIEAEYVSVAGKNVELLRKDSNRKIKVPIAALSEEDRQYVLCRNAPKVNVESLISTNITAHVESLWVANPDWVRENQPVNITKTTLSATVTQLNADLYGHDLFVETYVLTKQCCDPENFHIIARERSDPFRLNQKNRFRYVYVDENEFTIFSYSTHHHNDEIEWGEAFAEYLILVRNEYDDVAGYTASSAWLYKYLDRLEKMPVGAWINDECIRIHPTTPEWGK